VCVCVCIVLLASKCTSELESHAMPRHAYRSEFHRLDVWWCQVPRLAVRVDSANHLLRFLACDGRRCVRVCGSRDQCRMDDV
jgi:hypothetical protein